MHRSIYLLLLLLILVLPLALVGSGWTPVLAAGSGPTHMYLPLLFRPATVWPQIALLPLVSGVSQPVHVTNAGDGSGRIFVVEQGGRIRIIRNGVLEATPFLDIAGRVGCCGERGLLSVAFPPGYAAKGHFYVNYTDKAGNTVVARYRLTSNPDVADPGSEQVVLTVSQPYTNHNGGQLAFGPSDGYLYIGMGDGGSGGDPENRAQNPRNCWASCCGSTWSQAAIRTWSQPPTPSPKQSATGVRSGRWACATPGASHSTGSTVISTLPTSARPSMRRSTINRAPALGGRTTVGGSWKAYTAITPPTVTRPG